jgi:8-oxo-dGTP pyrophosphatase MutT (NUDIX family)
MQCSEKDLTDSHYFKNIEEIKNRLKDYEKKHLPSVNRTAASVLIPLVNSGGEIHVLFIKRTETVRQHKGEISFPGGIFEIGDKDIRSTSLREMNEETGISAEHIDIIGEIDDCITVTGFHVTPFAGFVKNISNLKPDPAEIEEIFLVPLSHLADKRNVSSFEWGGHADMVYFYRYKDRCIWGATGRILKNFLDVISS